jgi:hypothetical protein
LLTPSKFRSSSGPSPNLSTQPVLVIEAPREPCDPHATNKCFGMTLDHTNVVSPNR